MCRIPSRYKSAGCVRDHVATAIDEIGGRFSIGSVLGIGLRDHASDHPSGLAADFMVGTNQALGGAVANYAIANAGRLGVKYVIWYQRIWQNGTWKAMADRGSITQNHKDHVHVSFNGSAGSGATVTNVGCPCPAVPICCVNGGDVPDVPSLSDIGKNILKIWDAIDGIYKAFAFFADPGNWKRVGLFLAGGILIQLSLRRMSGLTVGNAVQTVTGTVSKVSNSKPTPEVQ